MSSKLEPYPYVSAVMIAETKANGHFTSNHVVEHLLRLFGPGDTLRNGRSRTVNMAHWMLVELQKRGVIRKVAPQHYAHV